MIKLYTRNQVNEILETERNYRTCIDIHHNVINFDISVIKEFFSRNLENAKQAIRCLETYPEFFPEDKYDRSKIKVILKKLENAFPYN